MAIKNLDPLTKDSFFYNTCVSRENIIQMNQFNKTFYEFRKLIIEKIFVQETQNEQIDEIYIDAICNAYKFALQQDFSVEQVSTYFSIFKFMVSESFRAKMTSFESYEMLKHIIKNHTYQCEPYSIGIFSIQEGKNILEYMRKSFYKHYSMYEITLTKFIDYNIFTHNPFKERWPQIIPLDKGEEIFDLGSVLPIQNYLQFDEEEDEVNEIKSESKNEEQDQQEVKESTVKQLIQKTPDQIQLESELQTNFDMLENDLQKKIQILNENVLEKAEEIANPKKKK